jgi:alkaline phosphatase D
MLSLSFFALACAASVIGSELLDRNLAYSTPFFGYPEVRICIIPFQTHSDIQPQFGLNTREIHKRHEQHVRRQLADSGKFDDEHYATFYGGDFSNVCSISRTL